MASSSGVTEQVFVETSVQIKRLCGFESQRQNIEACLQGKQLVTSSTVFREFQVAIIGAYDFVRRNVLDIPPDEDGLIRIYEIDEALANSGQLRSGRKAKRIFLVTKAIKKHYPKDEAVSRAEMVAFLEMEIDFFTDFEFFRFGDYTNRRDIRKEGTYLDTVDCSVAGEPFDPKKPTITRISCDMKTRKCEIRSFLRPSRGRMRGLGQALQRGARHLATCAREVSIRSDREFSGRRAIGERLCWKMADVIIALECPAGAKMMSYDGDFDPLCIHLGIQRFPAPP